MRCPTLTVAAACAVIAIVSQFSPASANTGSAPWTRRPFPRRVPSAAALAVCGAKMVGFLNGDRARNHVAPLLVEDPRLDAIALRHSQDMVSRNYFSHATPGAGSVFDALGKMHVSFVGAGENIAENTYLTVSRLGQSLARTNGDLMHSRGHRANILALAFTKVGVGVAVDRKTNTMIVTEVFVQTSR